MNHLVQRLRATRSNDAASSRSFSPCFGQGGQGTDVGRHPVDDRSTPRPPIQVAQPWMVREASARRQTASPVGNAKPASSLQAPDAFGERFDRVTEDGTPVQVDGSIHAVYT